MLDRMTITSLYAKLVVTDAAAAIDFYTAALGAVEVSRFTGDKGEVHHAELTVGGTTIAVKDAGHGDPAPATDRHPPVIMALGVDDADAVADRMLAAGATVIYPIHDAPYGERGGRLADPFGHHWMISQPLSSA